MSFVLPQKPDLIGTEDMGLNLFDPETETFLPLPKALQSLHTNIHAIYNDGDFLVDWYILQRSE